MNQATKGPCGDEFTSLAPGPCARQVAYPQFLWHTLPHDFLCLSGGVRRKHCSENVSRVVQSNERVASSAASCQVRSQKVGKLPTSARRA